MSQLYGALLPVECDCHCFHSTGHHCFRGGGSAGRITSAVHTDIDVSHLHISSLLMVCVCFCCTGHHCIRGGGSSGRGRGDLLGELRGGVRPPGWLLQYRCWHLYGCACLGRSDSVCRAPVEALDRRSIAFLTQQCQNIALQLLLVPSVKQAASPVNYRLSNYESLPIQHQADKAVWGIPRGNSNHNSL